VTTEAGGLSAGSSTSAAPPSRTFRSALATADFTLTAELPLAPGTTVDDLHEGVRALGPFVTAMEIPDNTTAQPHMSPVAAAALVLAAGMDAVVHLNCRDRNRIALQGELMGAAALGVTSLVLSRGEKLPASLKQQVKGVFDIGSQRLLATARAISANPRLVAPPGFLLGANVTVIDPPADWSADGVDTKVSAGCNFLQTQPCLDAEILRRYVKALVARKAIEKVSLIVRVPLPDTPEALEALNAGRRPLLIAEPALERLRNAADFAAEAESLSVEMLRDAAAIPGISGGAICHGSPEAAARVAAQAGVWS
jgi:methylenetetrahydrofolate reductase (NADPH)